MQGLLSSEPKLQRAPKEYHTACGTTLSSLHQGDSCGNDERRVGLRRFLKDKMVNFGNRFLEKE